MGVGPRAAAGAATTGSMATQAQGGSDGRENGPIARPGFAAATRHRTRPGPETTSALLKIPFPRPVIFVPGPNLANALTCGGTNSRQPRMEARHNTYILPPSGPYLALISAR